MLLADDNEKMSEWIATLLSSSCDLVGLAADTAVVLESALQLRPDVILLDFSLPGTLNSLEVCRRIKAMAPEVNVVVFTADDDADLELAAYEAGAAAFVSKFDAASKLLPTIHAVADGAAPPV